ncbi:Der GTPase-activating protein YihI, partial [Vibrio parahaemolyticus]|nr:Der GTPase-activating protein YihI [Vibrio parahaemolyticus]
GLKTGNRNSEVNEQKKQAAAQNRDPRLGSKKKIPLIVEPAKKMTKQERRLSAEQELEMLENDAQLNVLLDRIEAGENLGTGLQKFVDEKLDRIEKLMDQLGLLEPEEEEDFTAPAEKSTRNDDDLLADFDDINFDDYKG